ncbi:MAG: hypothetical protein HZB26_14495 [Candidatus Hydrogenedentes bacterium]|nr:hypothetical protein [Candidatus Hydrogenedentota bacterium]
MFADENNGNWAPRAIVYKRPYQPDLGCWSSFDGVYIYPEYLADHTVTLCPSDAEYANWLDPKTIIYPVDSSWQTAPDPNPVRGKTEFPLLSDRSYVYWGYVVEPSDVADPADMGQFGRILDNVTPQSVNVVTRFQDVNITKPSNGQTVRLYRFREGVERFLVTDINNPAGSAKGQSTIAVMWDTVRTDNGAPVPNEYNHPAGANVLFMDGHAEFSGYSQPAGSKFWMLTKVAATDGLPSFP